MQHNCRIIPRSQHNIPFSGFISVVSCLNPIWADPLDHLIVQGGGSISPPPLLFPKYSSYTYMTYYTFLKTPHPCHSEYGKTSSLKYYYYRRPIGAPSENYRRPTCLIKDPSETKRSDQRPIRDLDMLHWRPILNRHA